MSNGIRKIQKNLGYVPAIQVTELQERLKRAQEANAFLDERRVKLEQHIDALGKQYNELCQAGLAERDRLNKRINALQRSQSLHPVLKYLQSANSAGRNPCEEVSLLSRLPKELTVQTMHGSRYLTIRFTATEDGHIAMTWYDKLRRKAEYQIIAIDF